MIYFFLCLNKNKQKKIPRKAVNWPKLTIKNYRGLINLITCNCNGFGVISRRYSEWHSRREYILSYFCDNWSRVVSD